MKPSCQISRSPQKFSSGTSGGGKLTWNQLTQVHLETAVKKDVVMVMVMMMMDYINVRPKADE